MRVILPATLGAALLLFCGISAGAASAPSLVEAARAKDLPTVRTLLKQHVDVNLRAPDGTTALHWAVHWGDVELAELLIRAGAQVNAVNDLGVAPLSLACAHGDVAIVELLLRAGAHVNIIDPSGVSPLMACARTGNVNSVKALLEGGADVDAKEPSQDQTALMWAVAERHLEATRTLLEHGAKATARSKTGYTPLLFAARVGDLDLVKLLLAAGANLNEKAADGSYALLVAIVRGHAALATSMLDLGADPNAMGAGYTPLHWAVGRWETMLAGGPFGIQSEIAGLQAGKVELVKALLAHGANPNAKATKNPPRFGNTNFRLPLAGGATPFFVAAMAADNEMMRLLLASGADPTLGLRDGTTALMVAAGYGRIPAESSVSEAAALEAVKFLLSLGNQYVNAVNQAGDAALHGVAYIGADKMLRLLVDNGANVNVVNKRGLTPLLIADGHGDRTVLTTVVFHKSMATILREMGADEKLGVPIE